jgi:hypothetical protein
MTYPPKSFNSPLRLAVAATMLAISVGVMGCAGNKSKSSDSSDYSSLGGSESSASAAPTVNPSQERVDEAKRSAEEAEQKAHDLRAEKAKASGN